jgi:4-amino-4-deoxy-L-arabinose transferase-like glycosyltransferase
MEKDRQTYKGTYFYIAFAGIFMLVICHSWLSDGMFMDGTIYAILSRNMANGSGHFWHPHLTNTLFPFFVEHPPLAFGLEGILFKVFGDNRFVERFYSLLTIIITGMIIVSIWKLILKKSSTAWLPLFFWITMETVTWASVNNMLENTLVIFICLSVLFYLKSQQSGKTLFLILAGLMLSLGFLTKGFVTFTPLAFPFFIWLFVRNNKFLSMVSDTVIILVSAVIPLLVLFLFTGAKEFLPKYIEFATYKISNGETISSRFYILRRLVAELLPSVGMILIFTLYSWRNKLSLLNMSSSLRPAALFFSLGMAGVLPILTTMDQSAYFLLLSFPFFAISLGLIVNPSVEILVERIDYNSNGYRLFKLFGVIALSAGIILSVYFSGDFNRDKNKLKDMKAILVKLKENSTINILPEMYVDWSLHTYYARYKNISLDKNLNNRHEYLLITTSLYSDTINKGFERIDLKTIEYELFRRRTPDTTK